MGIFTRVNAGVTGLAWLAFLLFIPVSGVRGETIAPLFTKTMTGGLYRHFSGQGVAIDGGGNFFVAGYTTTTTGGTAWRALKFSGNGTLLWSTGYDDYTAPSGNTAAANCIALDGSGNAVVAGMEKTAATLQDWLIRKYSTSGSLLWSAGYNNSAANNADIAYGVAVDSSGNIAVVGSEYRSDIGEESNWLVRKYSPGGTLLWSRTYDNPDPVLSNVTNDAAYGAAFDRNGNLFVAGSIDNQNSGTGNDLMVRKYLPNGDLAWSRTYGNLTSDNERASAVGTDASGNCFVAGSAENKNVPNPSDTDWLVLKYTGGGDLLWASTYTGPTPIFPAGTGGYDVANSVAVDARGNAVIAGMEEYNDTGVPIIERYNARIIVFSPDGTMIAGTQYNDPTDLNEEFLGVSCDPWGNAAAVGYMDWPYLNSNIKWRSNLFLAGYLRSDWPNRPPPTTEEPSTEKADARLSRNAFSADGSQTLVVSVKPDGGAVVSVRVYTASGRLVRQLDGLAVRADGWQEAVWDGYNGDGQRVSRGVYLVNVMSGGFNRTLKVVVR